MVTTSYRCTVFSRSDYNNLFHFNTPFGLLVWENRQPFSQKKQYFYQKYNLKVVSFEFIYYFCIENYEYDI